MKVKRIIAIILITLMILLMSCGSESPDYVSERFKPLVYDGTMMYSFVGGPTNIVYMSPQSGAYGPTCTDPLCRHTAAELCPSLPNASITAFTLDRDGNLLVSGRTVKNLSHYQITCINMKKGTHTEILSDFSNNISSMMVAGDILYFNSQLDDGDSEDGNHSICYVPVKGGDAEVVDLPVGDYYLFDADSKNLYVYNRLERAITAIDRQSLSSEVIYRKNNKQAEDGGFIDGNYLYLFVDPYKEDYELDLSADLPEGTETITRSYTTYCIEKIDLTTGETTAQTKERYLAGAIWEYYADGKLYVPAFRPILHTIRENNMGEMVYSSYYGTGVDVIDVNSMTVTDTVDIGVGIRCIAYADENIIVFSGDHKRDWIMGYYDRVTGETKFENREWLAR